MAEIPWTTQYPTGLDTNTQQPNLTDDQDDFLSSHVEALRDASQALQSEMGSNLLETGSLRKRVTDTEVVTDEYGVNNYLTTTLPTGVSGTIQALYQFDNSASTLTDRSANSNDLTLSAGVQFHVVQHGRHGVFFNAATEYGTGTNASVQLTAGMTLEVMYRELNPGNVTEQIVTCSASGELETQNALYGLRKLGAGAYINGLAWKLEYIHEFGAGTNFNYEIDDTAVMEKATHLYTVTRAANGQDLSFYTDGVLTDTVSAGTAPSGGSLASLKLGGAGTDFAIGVMFTLRLTDSEFTAAQVLSAYNSLKKF